MSNYTWVIDAGHGGVNSKGNYTTAPAKMHRFDDGFTIREGEVNRSIARLVHDRLTGATIDFALIYDDVLDWSLTHRIAMANKLQTRRKNCILVSIHSNAGGGSGIEVFTSNGKDKSDIIVQPLCELYKKNFPEFNFRADKIDGDLDKEANFAMVGGNVKLPLYCPAVLVENFFFDNRKEAELLITEAFQIRIADTIVEWIKLIEQTKPI